MRLAFSSSTFFNGGGDSAAAAFSGGGGVEEVSSETEVGDGRDVQNKVFCVNGGSRQWSLPPHNTYTH